MANLNGHLKATIADGIGSTAAVPIYFAIPEGATLTQATTEAALVLAALNNVTQGQIVSSEFRLSLAVPTPNDPAGSRLNDAIGLRFTVPSIARHWSLPVPAVASGLLSGGFPVMTEDGLLDVLADILESAMATTGTTAGFYTSNTYRALGGPAAAFLPDRSFAKRIRGRTLRLGV